MAGWLWGQGWERREAGFGNVRCENVSNWAQYKTDIHYLPVTHTTDGTVTQYSTTAGRSVNWYNLSGE